MTILIVASILSALLILAFVLDRGLTGAMRRVALWLVVEGRKIDERRAIKDARVRQGLAVEGGAL